MADSTRSGGRIMTKRFRKKPVEISAWRWDGDPNARPDWLYAVSNHYSPSNTLRIRTLEGTMEAALGDWIIQGVKGEVYPCKPDIFDATYDLVE